jgi:hypothetical protein
VPPVTIPTELAPTAKDELDYLQWLASTMPNVLPTELDPTAQATLAAVQWAAANIPNVMPSSLDGNADAQTTLLRSRLGEPVTVPVSLHMTTSIADLLAQAGVSAAAFHATGALYEGGIQKFAAGGFPTGIYNNRPGGLIQFAEGRTGYREAYITDDPSHGDRNRKILEEFAPSLGMSARPAGDVTYATGSSSSSHTTNHWTINEVGDASMTAERVMDRMLAGVR